MPTVTSVVSHFPSAKEGFTTTLNGTIASGATTVVLNSVSGYTNGATAVFVIDPTDATKKQAFTGIIDTAGVQVTNVVWTEGTNQTHTTGATVVDYWTATHMSMVTKGLLVEHAQTGLHTLTSSATMTSPKLITSLNDTNGNEIFKVTATGSAVNEVTIANAATGNNPNITASGGDSNVGLDITPKGTGTVNIKGNATQAGTIRLYEDTDDGSNYSSFKVGTQAGNVDYTLPTAVGAAGTFLKDAAGNGVLSWGAGAAGAMSLLDTGSGTTTNAAAETVDSIALSGLTALDTIVVYFSYTSTTQDTAAPFLSHVTDSNGVITYLTETGAAATADLQYFGHAIIMTTQHDNTIYNAVSHLVKPTASGGNASPAGFGKATDLTTAFTDSWTLGFRHGGVTAGGTLKWSWRVYKIAGQ